MYRIILIGALLGAMLASCSPESKPAPKAKAVVVVKQQKHQNRLMFNGYLQPLEGITITAPAEGTLIKKLFAYGQSLKRGQPLFELQSDKLDSDYQSALSGYIKAVETYQNNQVKWEGTEELNKAGLISRNDYLAAKNGLADSRFNLQQARQKLKKVLELTDNGHVDLEALSDEPTSTLLSKLKRQVKQMTIRAPRTGVALFANGEQKKAHEEPGMHAGSVVKQGDALLIIGNTDRLSVTIDVNERDIAQLKVGQKALVKSTAIPSLVLHGVVAHVSEQATLSMRGIPKFSARIEIPSIAAAQKHQVHVGMSVSIVVQLGQHQDVMVPLNAVSYQNHKAMITHPDGSKTVITPGRTTQNTVVIQQGVKEGEKIVAPTTAPTR